MRWRPPTKPLSQHFSWAELIRNSGYSRVPLGPTYIGRGRFCLTPRRNARAHAANLERLRNGVNRLRDARSLPEVGIRLLSWARSYEHNRKVGGASGSQHLYFRATDIALPEISRVCPWPNGRHDFDRLLETVFENGGVGEYPAGNRHCDSRGSRARWTVF